MTDKQMDFSIDVGAVAKEFEIREPRFKALREEALFVLERALEEKGIRYHLISSRIKKIESLIAKIRRKQSQAPFDEIVDIVGVRIVCLFLSDIPLIGSLIREQFEVISEDNKIEDQDVSSFGYLSVHFVGTMKRTYSGPRYDSIAGIPIEIQVRTIAMDAWANVSHYLEYKTEGDIPRDLRKDFYALSGLFYVADSHFEMFFKSREASKRQLTEDFQSRDPDLNVELNLDTLTAYLNATFPDREHANDKAVSDLLSELMEAGYKTVEDLARKMKAARAMFENREKRNPPLVRKNTKGRFVDVGVVRVSLTMIDPQYDTVFKRRIAAFVKAKSAAADIRGDGPQASGSTATLE